MLWGLLFLTMPNLAYANSNQVDKPLAENQHILEIPIEFLYPKSLAKHRLLKKNRETLYQFKKNRQQEAQDVLDGVNKIYKKEKINVKYVVHSVRLLDKNEASLYGVENNGGCTVEDSVELLHNNRGLPSFIQLQHDSIQGQENSKAIAATVLVCKGSLAIKRYTVGTTAGATYVHERRGWWKSRSMNHTAIVIDNLFSDNPEVLAHELAHAWGLIHINDENNRIDYPFWQFWKRYNLLMNEKISPFYLPNRKNTFVPEERARINDRIQQYRRHYYDMYFPGVLNFLPGDYTKRIASWLMSTWMNTLMTTLIQH